jgi:DNA primase (bacterial type)
VSLSELIESVDILEYISQYVELEEKGGEYWGLSPLKEENTPSFSVNKELSSFYDFSSGKGGNLLSFIRYYHNCSKQKAEEILRAYVGEGWVATQRQKMEATKVAKRFQVRKKPQKESKANILQDDYMERFEGRADKLAIWEAEGISADSLDKFQVRYDTFSDRLVYPIRNVDGKIINVSGRTVDEAWKEKNLRKYTYFKPLGILDTLYGLAENRAEIEKRHEVVIFEGAKSVMLADTWGVQNAVALLTSHLNQYQLRILAQLGCRAVFALDKGVSIREDENIRRLKRYVRIEYLWDKADLLEDKMSPVDSGIEVWKDLYKSRLSWN